MSTLGKTTPESSQESSQIVSTLGGGATYAMLGLIVFAETGLVVTPFLPGDSLLFATGAVCATVASVAAQDGVPPGHHDPDDGAGALRGRGPR